MKTITRAELEEILKNHQHWIKEDCEGWEDMKADLCGANLREADLREADLCGANLRGANLCGANLRGANLYEADLREANLRGANLREADLRGADLYEGNLCGADLRGADLYEGNLREANLRGANNIPFVPMTCPDTGSFIAWKKAGGCIVKLFIPSDARRVSATGRKCRCDKATVIAIEKLDGTPANVTEVCSNYDGEFKYAVHGHVEVKDFCEDRWVECSQGIHFFINREEAVRY